ncbi:zinc finger E-box-binding homeobox 2-like isoform X2 [Ptychodera flava]|uniref:zinc finger E-box-binding homeobox 2-like isoform X2 n=1 Tax=Ptychodera flava TaxID=63121 RepID=UPI00396A281F
MLAIIRMREVLSINSLNRNMAEGPRCTRRKQANPRRKKVEDIPEESDAEVEPENLQECRDSGNHSDGYHSNENELNHDEMSSNEGSFHGDDGYQSNKELREEEARSRGMNIQEYLSRSDTAIIYPEAPDEEVDNENDISGGNDDGEDTILSCPYCDRVYKRATSLKEHIKYRHEKNANNFACSECNYSFAYKSQLERHMATHMPGRDQICEICNKAFVNIYRLQRHMLTHSTGNRKFKCSECHKAFKYKHHLKEHLRIHSGEKPYECPTCKKRFSHSGSYSSHISSKKCTPLKYVPPLHSEKAAPVKVMNDKINHTIHNPLHSSEYMHPYGPPSFEHLDKPSMVPNQSSMMMPIHVKVENGDGLSAEKLPLSMASSPPNDAVKKVLQIVGATVSKQQQEGQNTDVAKLKKTKQSSSDRNPASPNAAVKQVDIVLPEMARERLSSKSPSANQSPEVDGKRKNYSIVDYTLRKVNEAKAVEAFASVHIKKDKNACRYCQELFYNPIELHQHERYLCEQNEDVKKVKNHASLTKFINFQREVVAMQENNQRNRERDAESDDEDAPQNDEKMDEFEEGPEMEVSDANGEESENGDESFKEMEVNTRESESKISENHQHALRAFFAMSQNPSQDGLEKISHLLSMPRKEVEEWFVAMRAKQGIESNGGNYSPAESQVSDKHTNFNNHSDCDDDNNSIDFNDDDDVNSPKPDFETRRGYDDPDCGQPLRITTTNSVRYAHLPPTRTDQDRGGLLMVGVPPEAHQNGLNLSKKALCNEEAIPLTKKRSSPEPISYSPAKQTKTDQPLDLSLPKQVKYPTYERRQPYFDNSKSVFHIKGYRSLPSATPDFYIGSFKVDPRMGQPYFENNIRAHCNSQPDPSATAALLAHGPIDIPHMYAHPIHNGFPDAAILAAAAHNPTKKLKLMDSLGLMSTGSPEVVGRHFMTEEELRKSLGVDVNLLDKQGTPYQQGSQPREESISEGSLDESIGEMTLSRTRRRKDRSPRTVNGMYACSQCPKTFQKHSSLLRHVYEHSGKRPHQCKECGKAFKHKHHLMEHSRLHSGEKPYQCDKCLKKFSHSGSYSQHMNHRYSYCKREDTLRQLKKEPQSVSSTADDRE